MPKFDLIVLGAGAAGLSVAAGAARWGARVALLEPHQMGGECLNTGCVPSKALLAAAKAAAMARSASRFGIHTDVRINFAEVKAHLTKTIATIAPHDSVERFEGLGCTVIKGAGQFISPTAISVNGETLEAKWFVIATGSTPQVPLGLPPSCLTNETIFSLEELPSHLVILGGGAVGCEMAQAFRRLGSEVTLVARSRLLAAMSAAHAKLVQQALAAEGVTVIENSTNLPPGSHLLAATGRTPRLAGLNLAAAGVTYSANGIEVDAGLRTANPRIFALGDCTTLPRFTHAASAAAGVVLQRMLFRLPARLNLTHLPRTVYTDPELAEVGSCSGPPTITKNLGEVDRAIAEGVTGSIQIWLGARGRLQGVAIAGPHAGDLLAPWQLLLQRKLPLSALAGLYLPYPTLGEVSKRAAGAWYEPKLFSPMARAVVNLLLKI